MTLILVIRATARVCRFVNYLTKNKLKIGLINRILTRQELKMESVTFIVARGNYSQYMEITYIGLFANVVP